MSTGNKGPAGDRGRLMWVLWALIFGFGIGFFSGYYLGVDTAQTAIEEGIAPGSDSGADGATGEEGEGTLNSPAGSGL